MSKHTVMVVEHKMTKRTEREALMEAVRIAGSLRELAEIVGLTKQAVHKWKSERIPADYIVKIERATGVPRQHLRPDLYEGLRIRASA